MRATESRLTREAARTCAREIYGIEGELVPLAGERDSNFRLESTAGPVFVLKVFDAAAGSAAVDCGVKVLCHLLEQDPDLPIPRPILTRAHAGIGNFDFDGLRRQVMLISFLDGLPLSAATCAAPTLIDLGRTLARIDRGLRGFHHPNLSQALAWDVRRLPEMEGFIPYLDSASTRTQVASIVRRCSERRARLDALRSQAIHGDAHAGNLLVRPTTATISGVVDFGDMIRGPLVMEAAVAMSELLTEGIAAAESLVGFLQGFTAVQKLQAAEIEHLHDLILARHAVTLLVHAWRVRHDPAGAEAVHQAAARSSGSLEALAAGGEAYWTRLWHAAAGTVPSTDLHRRRRHLMGAGAELFYAEPLHLVRGEGTWLFDADGRRYLDVYNNVPHVGHAHPAVVVAIARQAATLATHTRYLHGSILDYAEALCSRLPAHLDTCIFVNSGSEANDVAWRIARTLTGAEGGLVMDHAYHGITEAVGALTPQSGLPLHRHVATLPVPAAVFDPEATTAAVDRALHELLGRGITPAAFYLDTALTSNGIFDPPAAWVQAVTAKVRAAGGLVVADEVQYGLGRSGSHFWGFERRGMIPDVVTMGKPIGNGFPMGVVIASRAIVEEFQAKTGFFSTFGGNPVAAAAGLAVLAALESERLMENADLTGTYLKDEIATLCERHEVFLEVRGAGLMIGLEIGAQPESTARAVARRAVNLLARDHAVLTGTDGPGGNVLKLRPPLCFARPEAEILVAALAATAAALEA